MTARVLVLTACMVATSAYLSHASRAEPTPIREPLSGLPYQIESWRGRSLPPLTEEVLEELRVTDYTTRYYTKAGQGVSLYVGYYDSQRQGASIHSPLNCLPGAGWLPLEQGRRRLSVPSADGTSREIEVNRVLIQRGLDRQLVLYWYQSHGRVVASEYWGKVYSVADAIRYNRTDAALVRLVAPVRVEDAEGMRRAEAAATDLARAIFPLLTHHLPS